MAIGDLKDEQAQNGIALISFQSNADHDVSIISEKRRQASKDGFEESNGALPDPATAVPVLERWNHPKVNMWRSFATFYSFIVLGANDAAYGALIPYLEKYYNVNYTVVSLIFLSPMAGYIISALIINSVHMRFGQRGIAIIGSVSHLVAYTVICNHPPYPVLVVFFIVAGFGTGAFDGAWNAWLGDMANSNEVLGILHAFYGVGGVLSPLIATAVITRYNWAWYEFYYLMVGAAVLEILFLTLTFWGATGLVYRTQHPQTAAEISSTSGTSETRLFAALKHRVTWLTALFLLVYVGIEVSIGGWTVTFMLRIRHGESFASGMTSTGFWLGVAIGRIILGFVTGRLFRSEKVAISVYLLISMALVLVFWLVPNFYVSAVAVAFVGFFIAPMFPSAVVVATKLLPKHLHVAAIGFAAALGASGACALPFAVGAIAQAKGVWVLMPIVLALIVVDLGIWLLIPTLPKTRQA